MTAIRIIAWAGVGVCAVAALTDTVIVAIRGIAFTEYGTVGHGWPIITLTGLVSAVMGALILGRDGRQPIGWLLLVPGIQTCLSLALDAYSVWVVAGGGPGTPWAGLLTGWLASFFGAQIPLAANAVILLLAPDGSLPGRWWRLPVGAAALGAVLWATPPVIEAAEYAGADPRGGATSRVLFLIGVGLVVAAVLAGNASLFVKLRRSTGVRRAQIRWFLVAGVPLAGGLIWLLVVQYLIDPELAAISLLPLFAAELLFPLSIAVAVLRYRLYDIDLVLNRAWLVLGATAFVGVSYVVVVATAGRALEGFWPAVLVSAVVACAFQPLRSRLVTLADRMAYGRQVEPYLAMTELSRRLGSSVTPQDALLAVADACLRSTSVTAVTIELTGPDGRRVAAATAPAAHPQAWQDAETFPITDGAEHLGLVRVVAAPGRPLRPRDRAVLGELCTHSGVAFRSLRLDTTLEVKVAELAEVTAALERSRERVQQARIAEQQRLEEVVRSSVTPRLYRLADGLDRMADRLPTGNPPWNELTDEVTGILGTVRAVSHGIHSGLLDAYGLAPALAAHLGQLRTGASLVVSEDISSRRFHPGCEAAVYRSIVTALRHSDGISRVEVSLNGSDIRVVLNHDQHEQLSADIRDQVEARNGTVSSETLRGVPRWVIEMPAVPLDAATDLAGSVGQEQAG